MGGVAARGIDLAQVKYEWVQPALATLGLLSPARLNLVTGIGLAESNYIWMKQLNNGPALGFWQMEPFTHDDLWKNSLIAPCRSRIAYGLHQLLHGVEPASSQMITNPLYGAGMCAVKVWLAPQSLPAADDAVGMSAYHKRWYNSALGAADPVRNIPAFKRVILA
ncbi:hypothetical protein [Swingsia samuiensis]|uniref:Lytic transglycosylase domain-containing protein n=1 Tax=Swingsia samuiensis TaxID=1293412 RepID=A0A4Y6UI75_9PROT|nr:hypothetical protein [Swingsia samuiensis]QDH16510.1 hypothetical protein E3D00_02170 [Swingsia samuiensis]